MAGSRPILALALVALALLTVPLRALRPAAADACGDNGCCCAVDLETSCCASARTDGPVLVSTCGCSSEGELSLHVPGFDWAPLASRSLPPHAEASPRPLDALPPEAASPDPATPPPERS